MRLTRLYTQPETDPVAATRFRTVAGEDGMEYIVPESWDCAAVDVLLQEVFYPAALPSLLCRIPETAVPEWLWRTAADESALDKISAEARYGYERDFRAVLRRLAGGLAYAGWKAGIFADEDEVLVFFDELRFLLLNRIAAPEIALWAQGGLDWAYGITPAGCPFAQHRIGGIGLDVRRGGIAVPVDTPHPRILRRLLWMAGKIGLEDGDGAIRVTLPVENADSAAFIGLRLDADIRDAAEELGRRVLEQGMHHVMDACNRDSIFGCDPARNPALARAAAEARAAGLDDSAIRMAIDYAQQGLESVTLSRRGGAEDEGGLRALDPVISLPDSFIETALTGHGWLQFEAGAPKRHVPAEKLWDRIAEAIWASGAPSVLYRDHARKGVLSAEDSIVAESGSGGFLFYPQSEAPAATLDLLALTDRDGLPDKARLGHAVAVLTFALDAAISSFPGVLVNTARFRPLALGATNLAALLTARGLAYDSDEGRALAALATSCLTGAAASASSLLASRAGAFEKYALCEKDCLRQLRDGMSAISHFSAFFPALAAVAKDIWSGAHAAARDKGLRNAHLTVCDVELSAAALLGGQTRGISPETHLVRFEGYQPGRAGSAGLYGKKLNPRIPQALDCLGYSAAQADDICFYVTGHGTLLDAPCINHGALREKGFPQAALDALEAALCSAQHIRYAFNKWTLGADFCAHVLGFAEEETDDPAFDMLSALGFSEDEIESANIYCCGAMTLEGAPHLKIAHLPVFDCLLPQGPSGVRQVSPAAQVRMQAAVEKFLSGSACHTVALPQGASMDDIQKLLLLGWEQRVKRLSLWRDGGYLLCPVAAGTLRGSSIVALPKGKDGTESENGWLPFEKAV